jgi:ectoine hydroxylase-related dioxygenase (phytanoyl-CoA dioxygenase family)
VSAVEIPILSIGDDPIHTSTAGKIVSRLRGEGWCVVPDVVPRDEIGALRDAVIAEELRQREEWKEVARQIRQAGQQAPPSGVGHAQALINHIPRIGRCIADRRLLAAAEQLLGQFVRVPSVAGLVNFPGNERGYWHSDWPFNQTLGSHVASPYADVVMQLSGIVMLTEFTIDNGATLIVPRSHRRPDNPSGNGVPRHAVLPDECQGVGPAGAALFYDSRLWHAVAPNRSPAPRVAVSVRYSPWWMNLQVRKKGTPDHELFTTATSGKDNALPLIPKETFASLDDDVKPLFAHWVRD